MKKFYFISILILTVFTSFSQKESRTEELIKKLSVEKNLFMNAQSFDKLKPYLDDRLIFIHSNGMTENKSELLANLKNKKWEIESVDWKESNVRVFKNHTAILIGKATYHVHLDEKHMDVDLYFTEVWTKFKKGWVLLSRHGSKI